MADIEVIEAVPRKDPIYYVEKDELVEGGPEGPANRQAIAIANNLAYIQMITPDLWEQKENGYNINDRVLLDNGDIVKSTVSNNKKNPNIDLQGWVNPNKEIERASNKVEAVSIVISLNDLNDSDNTSFFNDLINSAPANAKVTFPYGLKVKGHFVSSKALNIDFNGCTFVNTLDDVPLVQIGSFDVDSYAVVESVLSYGGTTFTVLNVSTLFSVGDIGYLWDGATRSTSGAVNYETIKIKEINGNVITVENFIASYKGAAAIRFYHSKAQIKNPKFENLFLAPTSTHNALTSCILNAENPKVSNIESVGTYGPAVAIRFCYGLDAEKIRPKKAREVSSGAGYGLALMSVSHVKVRGVNGSGMRHVYDQDSVYFFDVSDLSDDDDKSSIIGLSHNGFAGHGTCSKVRGVTSQYPVVLSEQGYAGATPAQKINHPFRKIHVSDIQVRIRAEADVSTSTACHGVYFQNTVIGCSVDGVDVTTLTNESLKETSGSSIVRVNGVVNEGLEISNIKANKIGKIFVGLGGQGGGFASDSSQVTLRNINVDECAYVYHTQGGYFVNIDDVGVKKNLVNKKIGFMQAISGVSPVGAFFGNKIDYPAGDVALLDCTATTAIKGALPIGVKTAAAGLSVTDGQTLTINQIQEKSSWLKLVPPIGNGTIAINLPKPQTVADEIYINVANARPTVALSGENMNAIVSVAANEIVRLKVVGSKWSIVSRQSAV